MGKLLPLKDLVKGLCGTSRLPGWCDFIQTYFVMKNRFYWPIMAIWHPSSLDPRKIDASKENGAKAACALPGNPGWNH